MGPEAHVSSACPLPVLHRFSSDVGTLPCTDAVSDRLPYVKPANRRLSLLSNVYGRTEGYVANIESDILSCNDAVQMIVDRIHKRNAMSVTSLKLSDLSTVLNGVCSADETFS